MIVLKLSRWRAKRQTEEVSPETEEGISPGLPKNFWKSWADRKTRLPMDGEMHFQMESGNQAAMDHPQRGSRSEI